MNFDLNAKSSPQRRPHRRSASSQKASARNRNRSSSSSSTKAAAQRPSTASVPISVYRELSAELKATQTMLDSLHGQNQYLRKQNVHLQQEVDSIVQAAQEMQYRVGGARPGAVGIPQGNSLDEKQDLMGVDASAVAESMVQLDAQEVSSQLHSGQLDELRQQVRQERQPYIHIHRPIATMPPCVSEPPRPQEMPITPDGIEPLSVRSPEEALLHQPQLHSTGQNSVPQSVHFSLPKRQAAIETLNKIFTGREQPMPLRALDEESSEEIHMAWLVLIVFLIVVTAFGTGFLIVRPFLSNNR